jgi:hypothetical protein
VVYERGFDDLVRLVRPAESSRDIEWDQEQAAKDRLFMHRDGGPLRSMNDQRLRTYQALGIHVRIRGEAQCRPCRAIAARTYAARDAPLLPLADCRSRPYRICVCRYEPVVPDAVSHDGGPGPLAGDP